MEKQIPKDRNTCDFVHCKNFSNDICLRSHKAYEACFYTFYRQAYMKGINRKERLLIDLLDLVKQGQKDNQIRAHEIRKEIRKRSTETLNKMLEKAL